MFLDFNMQPEYILLIFFFSSQIRVLLPLDFSQAFWETFWTEVFLSFCFRPKSYQQVITLLPRFVYSKCLILQAIYSILDIVSPGSAGTLFILVDRFLIGLIILFPGACIQTCQPHSHPSTHPPPRLKGVNSNWSLTKKNPGDSCQKVLKRVIILKKKSLF